MIGENLLGPEPTMLPADPQVTGALQESDSLESVVRTHPESPLAWALLADEAHANGEDVQSYAYARVGYHRGLDTLRKSGWKGHGPIPWSHEPNQGVLRALYALRRAAEAIGETREVERLTEFLTGADPQAIAQIEGRG